MASVAARAVMGTMRVAPCPADSAASLDVLLKDPPLTEQSSWWPSLLSSTTPATETGDLGAIPSPHTDDPDGPADEDPFPLSPPAGQKPSPRTGDRNADGTASTFRSENSETLATPPFLQVETEDSAAEAAADEARPDPALVIPEDSSERKVETVMSPGPNAASLLSPAALADGGMVDMEADACSICLDSFSDADPAVLTKCNHEYHFQCVLEWAQRKEECPMCWQALQLSDPSSQELLDACARERKERVAAAEAQASLLNSTSPHIVFVRSANPNARSSRQRSASPWQMHSSSADPPVQGNHTPPRSVSSLFGLGHRHRTGLQENGLSASSGSNSADSIPLGSNPGNSNHSWFKRHGSSSRAASRGNSSQGPGVTGLSSTLSVPGTPGTTSVGRVQGTMSSSYGSAPALVSRPVAIVEGHHASREDQSSSPAISTSQRPGTASRLLPNMGGGALSPSLGTSPSWRRRFSLRHGRAAER